MLPFNEIKKDHRDINLYPYPMIEYMRTWYGKEVFILLDDEYLIIELSDNKGKATSKLDISEFIDMSYKNFTRYLDNVWYYSYEEWED